MWFLCLTFQRNSVSLALTRVDWVPRLQDIVSYSLIIANFSNSLLLSTPQRGFPWNCVTELRPIKLERWGDLAKRKLWRHLIRLDRIRECDRQTDRRTDNGCRLVSCLVIASRGKTASMFCYLLLLLNRISNTNSLNTSSVALSVSRCWYETTHWLIDSLTDG